MAQDHQFSKGTRCNCCTKITTVIAKGSTSPKVHPILRGTLRLAPVVAAELSVVRCISGPCEVGAF
ncbi:MAG: hypothetical protein CL849_02790 [Crocinitomicaceae bacterium]|nr:hypothetical protein [Crocinitomicaceae bacterium]